MTSQKVQKIIAIATSVCILLLGIAFIFCTAHLYFTGGDQPYSRESVGKYLLILALPSAITAGLATAGLVMATIKENAVDGTVARTPSDLLDSYLAKYDLSDIKGEEADTISKERKYRSVYASIAYSLSAAIFAVVLVYLSFFANFTVENLNSDAMTAFALSLPLCAVAVGVHVPRLYLSEDSCRRELEAVKKYVRENSPKRVEKQPNAKGAITATEITRYVIIAASVILIVLGVFNGGMKDVLAKAVKICTECIGLG